MLSRLHSLPLPMVTKNVANYRPSPPPLPQTTIPLHYHPTGFSHPLFFIDHQERRVWGDLRRDPPTESVPLSLYTSRYEPHRGEVGKNKDLFIWEMEICYARRQPKILISAGAALITALPSQPPRRRQGLTRL